MVDKFKEVINFKLLKNVQRNFLAFEVKFGYTNVLISYYICTYKEIIKVLISCKFSCSSQNAVISQLDWIENRLFASIISSWNLK